MPVFYFDVRDGEKFTTDQQGVPFNGIEDARDTATLGLAKDGERGVAWSRPAAASS
jgi:hypothetical protein